jgi:hypothetical protein
MYQYGYGSHIRQHDTGRERAMVSALSLLFLHQLRGIFRRVRDGDPFDAGNTLRLRRLGWLLGAFAVVKGVADLATSASVRGGLGREARGERWRAGEAGHRYGVR